MIYCSHDAQNLWISQCTFTNCKGDYVRFRDDTEYAEVDGCTFTSSSSTYNMEFILVPVFNDVNPGDEHFGGKFKITNNTFNYAGGTSGRRHCVQFRCDGHNVDTSSGLDYWTDTTEAATLNTGTASQKNSILSPEMELNNSEIKIYGNTYQGSYEYQTVYWHHKNYGSGDQGYTSYCNISNWPGSSGSFSAIPKLSNGNFEKKDIPSRLWQTNGGDLLWHPGLNGTNNAMRTNPANSGQYFYNWIDSPQTTWTMDCLFLVGSGFTGTGVKFRAMIQHDEIGGKSVSFGVNNSGQVGLMTSGSSLTVIPSLGTIAWSVDNNSNSYYNDAGDTMNWYHLQIVGDYSGATPHTDVYLSEANTMTLTRSALSQTIFVGGCSTGVTAGCVDFTSFYAPVVVDEVTWQ